MEKKLRRNVRRYSPRVALAALAERSKDELNHCFSISFRRQLLLPMANPTYYEEITIETCDHFTMIPVCLASASP